MPLRSFPIFKGSNESSYEGVARGLGLPDAFSIFDRFKVNCEVTPLRSFAIFR